MIFLKPSQTKSKHTNLKCVSVQNYVSHPRRIDRRRAAAWPVKVATHGGDTLMLALLFHAHIST